MDLYAARDYRDFLNAALDSDKFGRGARAQLAEFLGVQNSFISQVLSGKQDFNLEHVFKICEFLSLQDHERDFILLMVQRSRAGSAELKNYFQKQMDRKIAQRNEIKNRVARDKRNLSEAEVLEYYGAWYHTAIHMILRNPNTQEPKQIAQMLGLDLRTVSATLGLLEKLGFIEKTKTGWNSLQQGIHLAKKSAAVRAQHANWRLEAIRTLTSRREKDLQYTAVMSIDAKCADAIRAAVLNAIESCDSVIRDAKDEEVHALTIDLFKIV